MVKKFGNRGHDKPMYMLDQVSTCCPEHVARFRLDAAIWFPVLLQCLALAIDNFPGRTESGLIPCRTNKDIKLVLPSICC